MPGRHIIAAGGYPVAYEQNMASGQLWAGTAPTNQFSDTHADKGVYEQGAFRVPIDTVNNRGGLFTPNHTFPLQVKYIELVSPAGTTAWTFSKLRKDASEHIFLANEAGAIVGDFVHNDDNDEFPLILPGERIKLVSTGTPSAAAKCTIYLQYCNR